MKVTHIPFHKTGYFSKTMIDYLDQKSEIQSFYGQFPTIDGFKKQIAEKRNSFHHETRKILVETLKKQYIGFDASETTLSNIESLLQENSFTVTTGHQLNLFTGPLYFLYKIISTINLCEELAANFPKEKFIPIYWMATEDHDFDEINFFNFKGTKVVWNREDGGAVGRFSTEGLQEVFETFSQYTGTSRNAKYILELFEHAYLKHSVLSDATRYVANELFKEYGLVILDADEKDLKELFAPVMKSELLEETSFKSVNKTIRDLEKNYKVQVNPREINLFYLGENFRERIVFKDEKYSVINTELSFSKEEILHELELNPENFSPNVIMRPLYQEVILPNLCYIGGGGEMAYWLQLKEYFNRVGTSFPILLLRNSVLIVSKKQAKKLSKLAISNEEIFLNQHDLLVKKIKENSDIKFSFADAKELLTQQFLALRRVADETDASFIGAVDAQERKQIKGLENLEKRLLKAEKRKHTDLATRITDLQNELFPNQSLEERQRNFSELYIEYGSELITSLKEALKPLKLEFTILEL